MRLLTTTLVAALGGLLAAHGALAQTASSTSREMSATGGTPSATMDTKDMGMAQVTASTFVEKMSIGDMFEIQSSTIALEKSSNREIKDFARMMVKDHTDSTQKLKDAARKANSNIEPPATLDDTRAQKLDKLRGLSGMAFDQQYVTDQLEGHDAAADLLRGYSKSGDSNDLKQFAGQALPVVESHRTHLKKIDLMRSAAK